MKYLRLCISMMLAYALPVQSQTTGYIVFSSDRDGDQTRFAMGTNGTAPIALTTEEEMACIVCQFFTPPSPTDPDLIAANTWMSGGGNSFSPDDIILRDRFGNTIRQLTDDDASNWSPQWSPDGEWIVYQSLSGSQSHIYLVDIAGTSTIQLTDRGRNWNPQWSPDGLLIAFLSDRDGDTDVYTMQVDGTRVTNWSNNAETDAEIAWSPSGEYIAFASQVTNRTFDILTVNTFSGEIRNLTNSEGNDHNPHWSPNELSMLFDSDRDGNREIYSLDIISGTTINLTNHPADDWYPLWWNTPSTNVESISWGAIKRRIKP